MLSIKMLVSLGFHSALHLNISRNFIQLTWYSVLHELLFYAFKLVYFAHILFVIPHNSNIFLELPKKYDMQMIFFAFESLMVYSTIHTTEYQWNFTYHTEYQWNMNFSSYLFAVISGGNHDTAFVTLVFS